MKKLLFGAAALLLLAGCSGNCNNETTDEASQDSAAVTVAEDSVKPVQEAPVADKTSDDKKDKDASKPSPNAKKIDKLLKNYMHDTKVLKHAMSCGMMGYELGEIYGAVAYWDKKLKKYEKEMTPKQKAQYKKIRNMY